MSDLIASLRTWAETRSKLASDLMRSTSILRETWMMRGRLEILRDLLRWLDSHSGEVETPWWEPRPWGEIGPSPEEIPQDELGEWRIDVFEPGLSAERWSSAGWYEAKWRLGQWCWSDSDYPVKTATHWRPKGPAPEVKP